VHVNRRAAGIGQCLTCMTGRPSASMLAMLIVLGKDILRLAHPQPPFALSMTNTQALTWDSPCHQSRADAQNFALTLSRCSSVFTSGCDDHKEDEPTDVCGLMLASKVLRSRRHMSSNTVSSSEPSGCCATLWPPYRNSSSPCTTICGFRVGIRVTVRVSLGLRAGLGSGFSLRDQIGVRGRVRDRMRDGFSFARGVRSCISTQGSRAGFQMSHCLSLGLTPCGAVRRAVFPQHPADTRGRTGGRRFRDVHSRCSTVNHQLQTRSKSVHPGSRSELGFHGSRHVDVRQCTKVAACTV